ncbi:50S ribosomal protein L14 [Candidatus Woesearchaeota archaeon]|nr:50S ribosomal protein L14P [uncultured archaeon]MBI2663549.1 50S ribosomal protein L14 [Candidatus Woesearchaeota archaeon]
MKAVKAKLTRGIPVGANLVVCDNSGAKIVRIFTVVGYKSVKRRLSSASVGDLVMGSVKEGRPDIRKQVVFGIVVRQKKEYRRPNGERIKFEDNALIVLKDNKGNPRGTMIKGPIAKEAVDRWANIGKIASIVI